MVQVVNRPLLTVMKIGFIDNYMVVQLVSLPVNVRINSNLVQRVITFFTIIIKAAESTTREFITNIIAFLPILRTCDVQVIIRERLNDSDGLIFLPYRH